MGTPYTLMGYNGVVTAVETQRSELVRLELEGMSCASCAARIERRLNRLDGVEATVNYATEQAAVACDPAVVPSTICVAAVERRRLPRATLDAEPRAEPRRAAPARRGSSSRVALTVPLALLSMVPPLQFDGWEWVALVLPPPVVLLRRRPFHRAAFADARHGAATMDTLISLGTLAAWTWSVVVLVGGLDADTYFEVGRRRHDADPARPLPRGARQPPLGRCDPRAARAGREGGARAARRHETRVPVEALQVGDLFVVRPGRADRDRRRRRRRRVGRRPVAADR